MIDCIWPPDIESVAEGIGSIVYLSFFLDDALTGKYSDYLSLKNHFDEIVANLTVSGGVFSVHETEFSDGTKGVLYCVADAGNECDLYVSRRGKVLFFPDFNVSGKAFSPEQQQYNDKITEALETLRFF